MNAPDRISGIEGLPSLPGSYALALRLSQARALAVGRLGRLDMQAGVWLYVGSARGPGGLRARVGRHWRGPARVRWHVDYLRRVADPYGVALRQAEAPLECRWAALLADAPEWAAGPRGFGASDCRCRTHLFGWASAGDSTLADELAGVLSYDLWLDAAG